MRSKRNICFLLFVLLIISAATASAEKPRYLEITFISTNDLHLHDLPFTLPADAKSNRPAIEDVGGMARIATIINKTRAEKRTPVLVVDSGDTTHGSGALARAFRGGSIVAVMNAIGYDAMVPGNHDFQWHSGDLLRNLRESTFPWVCANVVYKDTGKPFTEPYVIKEVDGVRIAIFGLTNNLVETQPNIYLSGPELGLKALDPTEVASKLVPELREKADIVVLLSHLGFSKDKALAKAVPGIDIILGGHTHTKLDKPEMTAVGQPTAFWIGAVPITQAWYYGIYVGKTRLIFHRDRTTNRYTLMSCKGELVPINNSIPEDPKITGIIRNFQKRIPKPPAPASK
ncbi:MAG: bifunctional UDP-sugar hydrolase/5'-nucleotidase [Armatimonadota bacterium]|nr:bifunctional UDP-sugar hydrolase/5'-nucleotidase [Armatimonadota bacterium]